MADAIIADAIVRRATIDALRRLAAAAQATHPALYAVLFQHEVPDGYDPTTHDPERDALGRAPDNAPGADG